MKWKYDFNYTTVIFFFSSVILNKVELISGKAKPENHKSIITPTSDSGPKQLMLEE